MMLKPGCLNQVTLKPGCLHQVALLRLFRPDDVDTWFLNQQDFVTWLFMMLKPGRLNQVTLKTGCLYQVMWLRLFRPEDVDTWFLNQQDIETWLLKPDEAETWLLNIDDLDTWLLQPEDVISRLSKQKAEDKMTFILGSWSHSTSVSIHPYLPPSWGSGPKCHTCCTSLTKLVFSPLEDHQYYA